MARAGPQTRPHRPDTDQKIDIHGVGLIGRTDEGEVASEMQMMWGGVVDWTPEAKVKIAQATKEIGRRLEVDEETANRLWEGMSDVYEFMAGKGLCAYPGGEQSVRVIPEVGAITVFSPGLITGIPRGGSA
jgi:hypothetical protein